MTRAKAHTALLALFAIAFIGALPASPAHAKTTLRAAQVLNDTHPSHLGLLRMAELLKERSGGELEIRMLDRNTLGDERDLIEAIQMGEADLIVIGTAPLYSFTSDFLVFDLPYTFKDAPTGRAVMDGPFGQARLDDATHVGLKGLAYYENGLRHVSTSKAPVRLPGDMKGLRMRTMESRIHLQTFRQLGAYPVPLSYMDLYRHLKDGSIDAEENPTSVFVTGKLYEVQANFSLTGHFYMPSPMFVSMGVWNKLPPNLQGLLTEAARESAAYQRELSDYYYSEEALDELSKKVNIIRDIDKDAWRQALAPVRKAFEPEVGPDTMREFDLALKDAESKLAGQN